MAAGLVSSVSRTLGVASITSLLRDFSFYRTGGEANVVVAPRSVEELSEVVRKLARSKTKYFLLGAGTNSLVMDERWDGAVILFHQMLRNDWCGERAWLGAGLENTTVAKEALLRECGGAAWMNRLPGQLGATVRMNARCYGGEISQIVKQVRCVSATGEIKTYQSKDVFRGYKDTLFMKNGDLVAEAEIVLFKADVSDVKAKMDFCETDRVSKGQFRAPSCGCVFKNDYSVGVPSGLLIDRAGLKGLEYKGARVGPEHANFIFNEGASSRAILELSFKVREEVYARFGVWMEYEMEVLGSMPEDLKKIYLEKRAAVIRDTEIEALRRSFSLRGEEKKWG